MADEQRLVRVAVQVPAAEAEQALAALIDVFPGGIEEVVEGSDVVLAGYVEKGAVPSLPGGLRAVVTEVPAGWRDAWRAFHRPVVVDGFWIGPPWLEPEAGLEAVVIEPAQAFGTGAHGSTQAAAELLLREEPSGSLLDLGCGSGVLAVIAARRGFAPVLAVDSDPLAVEATAENAARNGVELETALLDALCDPIPATDLAVANLQHELLVPLFARGVPLPRRMIVSGLLAGEPFAPAGWRVEGQVVRDGWKAMLVVR